jgi:hypothetical protein
MVIEHRDRCLDQIGAVDRATCCITGATSSSQIKAKAPP